MRYLHMYVHAIELLKFSLTTERVDPFGCFSEGILHDAHISTCSLCTMAIVDCMYMALTKNSKEACLSEVLVAAAHFILVALSSSTQRH